MIGDDAYLRWRATKPPTDWAARAKRYGDFRRMATAFALLFTLAAAAGIILSLFKG